MGWLIGGVIVILIGAFFYYLKTSEMSKVMALGLTETYTAQKLKELQATIAGSIGAGSFKQMAEVRGAVECSNPVTSEISKEKCVYYKSSVSREIEETYYEEDEKKNRVMRTRRTFETVSDIVRSVPFYIKDETGRIKIDPTGAEIDLIQVVDRYEPAKSANYSNNRLSFGSFMFEVGDTDWSFFDSREGRKILGYKLAEHVFQLNRDAFVLGEVSDSTGELTIRKPTSEKETQFLISNKSEDQIVNEAKQTAKTHDIIAKICFVVGIVMAVFGVVKGLK